MYSDVGAPQLIGLDRCPHCSIASPSLYRVWWSEHPTPRQDGGNAQMWAAYACRSCGGVLVSCGFAVAPNLIDKTTWLIWPRPSAAHEDIPEPARTYLQQALETLHAPDAAAVMAGSAVDAMLKVKGLEDGSLYARIDKALAENILTQSMADWAHEVRLGSNRPRHSDSTRPHVTPSEAQQSVEFAEALGHFLFVLTARIQRGIVAAKSADGAADPS